MLARLTTVAQLAIVASVARLSTGERMEQGWLPLQEAAKKYEVKPRTLNRWCRTKPGLAVKRAGFWQVNEAALVNWLAPVEVAR